MYTLIYISLFACVCKTTNACVYNNALTFVIVLLITLQYFNYYFRYREHQMSNES